MWPINHFTLLHGPNESYDFDLFLETSQSGNHYTQTAVMITYHTEDMFTPKYGREVRTVGRTRSFSVDAGGPHNFKDLPFEPSDQMLDMMEGSKQYHCRCLGPTDTMLNVLQKYLDFISSPDPNYNNPFEQKKPKLDPGNGIHR